MQDENFSQQIRYLESHMKDLLEQVERSSSIPGPLFTRALEDLQGSLEELSVAEEELHQQTDELATLSQALAVEGARYQELFEGAPDGYLITDTHGVIRQANRAAAALLNISQNALVGKPLLPFIAESERKSFWARFHQLLQDGTAEEWELWLQPRDRGPVIAGLTFSTLTIAAEPNRRAKVVSVRWLLRDLTKRKQMEE